jgi:hypothetical protein
MCFKKEDLKKAEHPLYGFGNKRIEALGKIDVNVTFGQDATMRTEVITFDVVDFVYPYNAIFGRNTINKFAAVIHQGYLLMKIPTAAGVISVYGSQEEARRAERNTSVHNRQVHVINEDEGNEPAVAEEQRAEAQMRQSMKGAEAECMKAVNVTMTVPLCGRGPNETVHERGRSRMHESGQCHDDSPFVRGRAKQNHYDRHRSQRGGRRQTLAVPS